MSYDDGRYNTVQVLRLGQDQKAQTSVIGAAVVHDRATFMQNVTVTDFSVMVYDGCTTTGAAATTAFHVVLGKSLAGTGAVSAIGTAEIGTAANNTVIDAAVTDTDFDAGDDIVLQFAAGTALPAGMVKVAACVEFKERFV